VKYFFLTEGWTVGRIWGVNGLWNEIAWRRKPDIQRLSICLVEKQEVMWLYRVEDEVMMVEVKPLEEAEEERPFAQVVLKRLMDADQVLERLSTVAAICQMPSAQNANNNSQS
jgi:hypothetical protein